MKFQRANPLIKVFLFISILIFTLGQAENCYCKLTPQVIYRIHGLNFGPYTREGQDPNYGTVISEQ
ncbi:MAG: hypothetical protein N2380_01760 [bacterium]|nr:hypothetical protein [bacterium]